MQRTENPGDAHAFRTRDILSESVVLIFKERFFFSLFSSAIVAALIIFILIGLAFLVEELRFDRWLRKIFLMLC